MLGRIWTPEDEAIRDLVIDCLSIQGSRYRHVSVDQHRVARELADGCGPIHPTEHATLLWDWQHVLDSTPGGFRRIHEYLHAEGVV